VPSVTGSQYLLYENITRPMKPQTSPNSPVPIAVAPYALVAKEMKHIFSTFYFII